MRGDFTIEQELYTEIFTGSNIDTPPLVYYTFGYTDEPKASARY